MGRVASGKSALAQALADELGWPVLSSDRLRKALAGVPLRGRTDAPMRAALYSAAMTERTYTTLFESATRLLKEGRSVLLDATFSRRAHRDRLRKQLKRLGVSYRFIEAQVSEEIARRRLQERDEKPDEISDARIEDLAALNRRYEPPRELRPDRLLVVNTAAAPALTLTEVLKQLARCSSSLP
ncbi:MAG: AAA family ATPase [Abditibacteriales bacterium]|nr:AAA family ATPase [Abditibacteriales bacterium]